MNLKPHITTLARELNVPEDPEAMTREQQYAVFDRLDGYVRRNDPELWRTKQLSDFLGGVWGQVFSPPYTILLSPFLKGVGARRRSDHAQRAQHAAVRRNDDRRDLQRLGQSAGV